MQIVIPKHAEQQMEKRGISRIELLEAIEFGELIFEEKNHRFGLKKYSKLKTEKDDLIAVWFYNKKNQIQVVTTYWRRKKYD